VAFRLAVIPAGSAGSAEQAKRIDVMWAWGIGNPYWRGSVPWIAVDLAG
jgi:hypothetical protein